MRKSELSSVDSTLHEGCEPMYWRVALLVLLTTVVPQAKAEPPDEQALGLLNHYRQIAGADAGQARSKAQRGVHGARKLHAGR